MIKDITLDGLSQQALQQLRATLYVQAFELAQSNQKLLANIDQKTARRSILNAAHTALTNLLQSTNATLAHLQQSNGAASLIEAQEKLLEKYQAEINHLPKSSKRIPDEREIHIAELQFETLEFRRQNIEKRLLEIEELLRNGGLGMTSCS